MSVSTNRPGRGCSIIDFPDDYVVVDIETTGLSPEYCEIIEICAIRYHCDEKLEIFSTLVKPENEIDPFITSLTGITNGMVRDAPSVSDSILRFKNFVENDIIVGYNVGFDINFLYDNLRRSHNLILANPWINIQRIAKKLQPDLENYQQATVAALYGISIAGAHRAERDCEICHALFEQFKKEIMESGEGYKNFKARFQKKARKNCSVSVTAVRKEFDETNPLYGKTCVFTGKLERMPRKDAAQIVVDLGGYFEDRITKRTNYLILGNFDYSRSLINGKSNKYKQAEQLILRGQNLQILSENVFYDMVFENNEC